MLMAATASKQLENVVHSFLTAPSTTYSEPAGCELFDFRLRRLERRSITRWDFAMERLSRVTKHLLPAPVAGGTPVPWCFYLGVKAS